MKVTIEVPNTGLFPYQFVQMWPLMMFTAQQKGININYNLRMGSLIYDARECAVKSLLESDSDAILFLDSDMVPTADMLTRLIEHDKSIVTALAFKRVPPYTPCIFKHVGEKEATAYLDYQKGLLQIEACGMACCLIKREIFEKIPQPWFTPSNDLGEDLLFCLRAKQAGIPIYCDTELICGHVGSYEIGEEHYANWRNVGQK